MTAHARTRQAVFAHDTSVVWTSGVIIFAGVMMIVAGAWHALAGIAALFKDTLYLNTADYLYSLDLTGWGWGHLALGVLVAATGGAILGGLAWGRVVGIALVVLSLIANFLFLPWYPIWSLVIIALDIAVIWALAAWPTTAPGADPTTTEPTYGDPELGV